MGLLRASYGLLHLVMYFGLCALGCVFIGLTYNNVLKLAHEFYLPMNQSDNNNIPEIKLYGYPTSPFVLKTGCVLKYKKLPFEFVPANPLLVPDDFLKRPVFV